ncbi:N-acetylneuraminate synthase family protein [Paenibacillus sp. IB182496]|uniref:N-acetylneuraminate synthase family protein n=1 Tax=Paenibacillus sabuli TaxID=2772509 RepID=A0A927BPU6_9BACL|nr:N-acetylneuraminate synthase family protein [Paenibacillus sabuli]MBD2844512.1 N-acetylneuraminate synthase family protein [Paenibacillus sabuli]
MSHGAIRIIAEIGVNHDGSPDRAATLIDAAASAGADIVKLQLFDAEQLAAEQAPLAAYQQRAHATGTQRELLRRLQLAPADVRALAQRARERGVEFTASPFDAASAAFLAGELGARRIKIASGELTNDPLLVQLARSGCQLLLSTGMSTLAEIEHALGVLAWGFIADPSARPGPAAPRRALLSSEGGRLLAERVVLLHAVSLYPAPAETTNLRALDTLAAAFGLPTGLSDHSTGIAIPIAAAARGACMIEKHLTLDRTAPGVDHAASLEPAEFAAMTAAIREVEQALGSGRKVPCPAELDTAAVARRSIVAARPIAAGERFTSDNLALKRPGGGLAGAHFWRLIGTSATRAYAADERIE